MNINNRTYWARLKVPGATVSVDPARRKAATVFQVKNIIDVGRMRRKAVLENIALVKNGVPLFDEIVTPDNGLALPKGIGDMDIICTSRHLCCISNVYSAMKEVYANAKMGPVVPEVLAPGDFLIFKQGQRRGQAKLSLALRLLHDA